METNTLSSNTLEQGETVVITNLVKEEAQASYDAYPSKSLYRYAFCDMQYRHATLYKNDSSLVV